MSWFRHSLDDLNSLVPRSPGTYVIFADGVPVYVGSTTNLRSRLFAGHQINFSRYSAYFDTPWGQFRDVGIAYRPSKRFGDWAMVELRLIRRLQPKFNCWGSVKRRRESRRIANV